jgi:hypothetical protein
MYVLHEDYFEFVLRYFEKKIIGLNYHLMEIQVHVAKIIKIAHTRIWFY